MAGGSRSCAAQPATSQPCLSWNDSSNIFVAPGGDMEGSPSAAGRILSGGASLLSGSESFGVTGHTSDAYSLGLPGGGSVMTPQICVAIQDP